MSICVYLWLDFLLAVFLYLRSSSCPLRLLHSLAALEFHFVAFTHSRVEPEVVEVVADIEHQREEKGREEKGQVFNLDIRGRTGRTLTGLPVFDCRFPTANWRREDCHGHLQWSRNDKEP